MTVKWLNYLAAIFWGAMVGLRVRQAFLGDPLAVFLAMQSGLIVYRIMERDKAKREASLGWRITSWASAMLPLAALPDGTQVIQTWASTILAVVGLSLAIWALVNLGRAFGIAPADRGLVTSGPYRWLRHPAYAGEVLSVLGYVLGSVSMGNAVVLLVLAVSLLARIMVEERMIEGYGSYKGVVRWRLIPGIW